MSDEAYNLEIKGLEKLIAALKGKPPIARVGILGGKAAESHGKLMTNAAIGACHEFGTATLPQRSFLREPISEHLTERLEQSGAFDKEVLKEVVREGTILPWVQKVAVLAEGIVADAFDTGGFGKWKPSNMTYKENQQTLVETTQLRNSITSEVK